MEEDTKREYILRPFGDAAQSGVDHPAGSGANVNRVLERCVAELIGVCKGVLIGGRLSANEAAQLQNWLQQNPLALEDPMVGLLATRIGQLQQKAEFGPQAEGELKQLVENFVGGNMESSPPANKPTLLPVDQPPPDVAFDNCIFCLTGKFEFGTRAKCEEAIARRGGICYDSPVNELDYLVIGTLGNPNWLQSSYGSKIQWVVKMKAAGSRCKTITEEHWKRCLEKAPVKEPHGLVCEISDKGIRIRYVRPDSTSSGPFAGKTVAMTGNFASFKQDQAKQKLRTMGAIVVNGVTAQTDYVVVGEWPGKPAEDARSFGVKTLTEQEFLKLLGS